MTKTSPIVQQADIEHTILYELNELIRAYPEWFVIGAIVIIVSYFAFKK